MEDKLILPNGTSQPKWMIRLLGILATIFGLLLLLGGMGILLFAVMTQMEWNLSIIIPIPLFMIFGILNLLLGYVNLTYEESMLDSV